MSGAHTRTRVKICGITNNTDLEAAIEAGVDAIGVISEVPVDSPRAITRENARSLIDTVPPFVTSVLVAMPSDPSDAIDLMNDVDADVLQVHGTLTPAQTAEVAEHVSVISAVDVYDDETIAALDGVTDAVLIDSTDDAGAGGTGESHDWDRTREYVRSLSTPVILAGGLTPENVSSAIAQVKPYGVDVASGVEGASGKDHDAMQRFVTAAHGGN